MKIRPAVAVAPVLVLLLLSIGLATTIGSVHVPIGDVVGVIWTHAIGGAADVPPSATDAIVWQVRMPRILMAALVGVGLSVSGALYQSLLRNPLAEPYLLGVSSGAGFAAVVVTATGMVGRWGHALPMAAFGGAIAASLLIVLLARGSGRVGVANLILAGVALGAFLQSMTAFFLIRGQGSFETVHLLGWLMGSLSRADWSTLVLVAPYVLVPLVAIVPLLRWTNVLLLGERQARNLGVPVEVAKAALLALAGLLAAASVAGAGLVGFVGLIVPHTVRLAIGPDNRALVPVAACLGGAFVVACDALGRYIFSPLDIPVGIMTALFGAPFFLWLLRRHSALSFA